VTRVHDIPIFWLVSSDTAVRMFCAFLFLIVVPVAISMLMRP
jgi:hypothetical protein